MARGNVSGFRLATNDIPIVLGMIKRGDRRHDIAAWFGVNQGRIKSAEDGKYGLPPAAPVSSLPPQGAPGVKGRRMRDAANQVESLLKKGDIDGAKTALKAAGATYDANEP
ncbi:hypothetical protein [Methylobacterium haplocladii]|uniref:Uncharacterized protein n=1 Tax=Methylobacterium haplocladii TaxID=1176176 RepID=A0A512IQN1_9HYPH|nr:hypothetical protein [Methylobacterium haplocladii]GEO99990.1 hypothetical protein MHA02_23780 [Methylobacterium haplocladii]GLS60078.1 hypothetical protein GCM10007887_27550 [Methylobacterium haplocladii]